MPYKRGFTNVWRTPWETVNVGRLAELEIEIDGPITPDVLAELGLIRSAKFPVKILGNGEVTGALNIQAHGFSKSAKEMIEAAGGTVEVLERTDQWTQARPRTRRLPINRELKAMRVGKVGGPSRREALAQLEEREVKEA
jgi:large subunit ribosomal protein L15